MNDKIKQFDPPLDAGIRRIVEVLSSNGTETFESCEGSSGHAFLEPTVRFHGDRAEGFRVYALAVSHELPVRELRRVYTVNRGELEGPWWEMTFYSTNEFINNES